MGKSSRGRVQLQSTVRKVFNCNPTCDKTGLDGITNFLQSCVKSSITLNGKECLEIFRPVECCCCEGGQISFILFTLRNYLLFNQLEQRNIYSYYKKLKQLSENNSRTPGADVISAILQHRTTVARLQKRLNSRTQTCLGFYCDTIIKCCNTE